jgi:hypothetical protein
VISFPDGGNAVSPQITAAPDGMLFVAWREVGAGGLPAIHGGLSTDSGLTWSCETADREISQPAQLITNLAISADPCFDRGVHVVYTASFDTQAPFHYEVYTTGTNDEGASWSGETEITIVSHDEGGGRSASNPDVYVGAGQGVLVVWDEAEDAGGTNEIHVSRGPGPWTGAIAGEIVSFPDGEDGYRPSIDGYSCYVTLPGGPRDAGDDTFVLWTEFAGGATDNYEVHVSSTQLVVNAADETVAAGPISLRARPNPASASVRLDWSRSLVRGEIAIFDAAGRRVRQTEARGSGWLWDRRDDGGRVVPAGCYFARVRDGGREKDVIALVLLD